MKVINALMLQLVTKILKCMSHKRLLTIGTKDLDRRDLLENFNISFKSVKSRIPEKSIIYYT